MVGDAVSFVIPVRDGAKYLSECIESVLRQTVQPYEVIVVDDGSQDESAVIAESFGDAVRCLRREPAGQSAARNHGVEASRGDFIAFLDADDLAVPHRLERQMARFAARPELEFCNGYSRNFWSPEIAAADRKVSPQEVFTHGETPAPRHVITWTLRRELFDRLGGFNEGQRFGEDTTWLDRVDDAAVVSETIPEILALRRLHHANLTRLHYDQHLSEIVRHKRERLALFRRDRAKDR
jgi:glycosyltransferase involved in cell wall biosynthesis